ncbi:MAG: ABC transporter ATP-binding protein [Thermoanaerobaculia bacterium]|nr:ABC transporter ATP-binding protein [Thermoanaerobaculia bacterium]
MSDGPGGSRLRELLPLIAPYRLRVAAGVGCVLLSAALGLAAPLLIGQAVDAFVEEFSSSAAYRYALLLVAATVVQGIFTFAQRLILVTVSRDVENDLRNRYFARLESLPPGYYQRRRVGDLMARGTNDMQAVRMLCGPAIMYASNTVFTSIGALVFMGRIHLPLTLVALSTLPLLAVATRVVGQRIHVLFESVQEQFSALSTRVQESLAGAQVVRAYTREEAEVAAFVEVNREYVERNRRLIRWNSAFRPLLQVLVGFGFVGVLWYGGWLVAGGRLTVGDFVSFNFFLSRLVWPMIAVGWVINLIQRGSASLNRILEVIDTEPEIRDLPGARRPSAARGALEVEGLTFRYPGAERPALREIDLAVAPGRTLAVVGGTGSGKSTLLALLPRLLDPPPGTVRLDGRDVRLWPLADLRGSLGMVAQEPFLFSTTIRDNIALGRDDAGEAEIAEAAVLAGLDRDLERLPDGLDTLVGERGVTLSGGQKQRVALARALLRRPRLLLLDDALSAVDTETEERILGHLRGVFAERSVILVSHRVSTVRDADEIVVLDDGRLVERGRHEELVAAGGIYADLERRQRLEEELEAV